MGMIAFHDMVDPGDPRGRTFKEVRSARPHAIPVGALVEIVPQPGCDRHAGVRLYVVSCDRDCDGTPLYSLAADRYDVARASPKFANRDWLPGFPEESLVVVRPRPEPPVG